MGWLNHADYLAAGNTWLQRFTFADVPSSVRSYRITRLTPGEEYWFIVASVDARQPNVLAVELDTKVRGDGGANTHASADAYGLSQRRFWSWRAYWRRFADADALRQQLSRRQRQPFAAGRQDDARQFRELGRFQVLASAALRRPARSNSRMAAATGRPHGRRWLLVNIDARNGRTFTVRMSDGHDYAVETDAGIAYSWNADTEIPAGRWYPNGRNLLFDIPSNASTAVVHLRPLTSQTAGTNVGVMWQVNIP